MSGVMNKLWTALRGGARELGDAVVDANGVRIFEQEIRDAKDAIGSGKRNLAEVMAKKMQTERLIGEIRAKLAEHEGYALKALQQENEALALEVAQKIAGFEQELREQLGILQRFEGHIAKLKAQIQKAEKLIAEHERELSIVKTTESVQKATVQIAENISANQSSLNSARDSLERIKKRQQDLDDRLLAGEELDAELAGAGLDQKLEAAGIKGKAVDAQDILQRLKARAKPQP